MLPGQGREFVQFLLERLVNRSEPDMGLAPPFDPAAAIAAQIQRIVECRPYEGARGAKVCEFGMPPIVDTSIGMTDHGNMFGASEFYNAATDVGIKPIIGIEAYIAPASRFETKRTVITLPEAV